MTSRTEEGAMRFTEEDAAMIAALRHNSEVMKSLGRKEDAWKCMANAARIVSKAAVQELVSGDFDNGELYYLDSPQDFAGVSKENKGVELHLSLLVGSPLYKAVVQLLQIDMEGRHEL